MIRKANSPFILMLVVVVTCIVAASGLAATYAVTKDRIAEQDRLAQERSLRAVLPDAVEFEEVKDEALLAQAAEVAGEVQVNGVFKALDENGEQIGWGLRLGSRGYGGFMQLVIGLDRTGKVAGVTILSMNETPGLGTKVQTEPWFLEQFTSLESGFTTKDVKALDSIAGATKSSRGVRHGVEAAGMIYADVLEEAGE